jgi:hypothetical protein
MFTIELRPVNPFSKERQILFLQDPQVYKLAFKQLSSLDEQSPQLGFNFFRGIED